jgi:hypothetical protein
VPSLLPDGKPGRNLEIKVLTALSDLCHKNQVATARYAEKGTSKRTGNTPEPQ